MSRLCIISRGKPAAVSIQYRHVTVTNTTTVFFSGPAIPQKCPFSRGYVPRLHGSLGSHQFTPKLAHDRFSRFCTTNSCAQHTQVHRRATLVVIAGASHPASSNVLRSLVLEKSAPQTASRSVQPFSHNTAHGCAQHTDTQTRDICSNSQLLGAPHLPMIPAMWSNHVARESR